MTNLFKVLTRKKVLDAISVTETQLARVLNTFDLTALGVGSTLGVGVYVLAGHVSKDTAGPAVVLSFLIAGLASVFAGLCYAEFGSRVPRAGSAYVYSYVTVGEFIAFIIGWNLILEYVIGSASVARGLSLYFDTLINNTMQEHFREIAPINVSFMSAYFDFFSFSVSILLSMALAFGMKESSRMNNVFTFINIGVVLFVVIAGALKANTKNWSLPAPADGKHGSGGFFPYGFSGVIKGAATCFYGFVGFDCIATTGEEVKNPQRAIPLSIVASLLIIFMAYFSTATVVTLMVPYFMQDVNAPIPFAFTYVGEEWARWVVSVGGIFGLCASLFGAMFPLPRIIYAMASDGIIFRFLGKVHPRFQTPLVGTLLAGLLTGLMSSLFELKQLVAMMSIGTLLAYTIVAACVLILRYSVDKSADNLINSDSSTETLIDEDVTFKNILMQTYNFKKLPEPTKVTQYVVTIQICIYALLCLTFGLCMTFLIDELRHAHIWAIALVAVIGLFMILVLLSIVTQPTSKTEVRFKVPWVPLIPALSILVNIYLMLMLDVNTWIRFAVWMVVGLPIYFLCIRCAAASSHSNYHKTYAIANGYARSASNSSISSSKNNSKMNGHLNASFVDDDAVLNEKSKEIKAVETQHEDSAPIENALTSSPSLLVNVVNVSPVAGNSPRVSLSTVYVNDALAVLDDILSKEENSDFTYERKISADSVSNFSEDRPKESVVALVHRADDITVPKETDNAVFAPLPYAEENSDIASETSSAHPEDTSSFLENCGEPVFIHREADRAIPEKEVVVVETNHQQSSSVNDSTERDVEIAVSLVHDEAVAVPLVHDEEVAAVPLVHDEEVAAVPLVHDEEEAVPLVHNEEVTAPLTLNEEATAHLSDIEDDISVPEKNSETKPVLIPPPPPIEGFEKLHPVKVDKQMSRLESVPRSPENSSSDKSAISSPPRRESVAELNDNVSFGSKEHAKIMSKLNKFFERQSLGLPSSNKLSKPEVTRVADEDTKDRVAILPGLKHVVAEEKESAESPDDEAERNVIVEEVMKPSDIKKKLNEILKFDPRLTMRAIKSNNVSEAIDQSEINKEGDAETNSPIAKTDDIARTDENPRTLPAEVLPSKSSEEAKARMLHKSLMNNTLNSIKLRKIESLASE